MQKPFKILILEHFEGHAEIVQQSLIKAKPGCEFKMVLTEKDYLEALEKFQPDFILSKMTLLQFDATWSLSLLNQRYFKEAEENLILLEKRILEHEILEQKKISRAIIIAQETEKNHIGKELHDNVNQLLVSTKLYLEMVARKSILLKEMLQYPIALLNDSMEEIRLLSHSQVTPLNQTDLAGLISRLITNLDQNTSIKTAFIYTVPNKRLMNDLKLNIYRIIQELINNMLKHADAKNLTVSIKGKAKTLHIVVIDDGKGFLVKSKRTGIGISNMINRVESFNGKLKIISSPGKGCKTNITIPY